MTDNDASNKVWVDGPLHPDLFDGDTPMRKMVDLDEFGLRVYKVECTYYTPEEETHFVVARDASCAEDIAWDKIDEEHTSMDNAEVTELSLDDRCTPWTPGRIKIDSKYPTARETLVKHIEEHGCKPTEPELFVKD